jgi:hypothetical protein
MPKQPMTEIKRKQTILLVKEQVLVAHESHFAGGIHLFNCLAASLAATGRFEVHVFTAARKSLVMHHALSHGLFADLKPEQLSAAVAGQIELLKWTSAEGVHFNVVVQPEGSTASSSSAVGPESSPNQGANGRISCNSNKGGAAAAAAIVEAVARAAVQLGQPCIVLLDSDRLQHVLVPGSAMICTACSCAQQQQLQQQQQAVIVPFMYALAQRVKHQCSCQDCSLETQLQQQQQQQQQQHEKRHVRLLMLVQNLHHLPFGPCGTAPRTAATLAAWQQVDGLLCVSHFVAGYMQQHAMHLLPLGSSSSGKSNGSSSVFVVHPAAVGAFGKGPFADLGAAAASKLWGQLSVKNIPAATQQQQQQQLSVKSSPAATQQQQLSADSIAATGQQGQQGLFLDGQHEGDVESHQQHVQSIQRTQQQQQEYQQQWQQQPVVGMLKLSHDKGSELFFALAEQLPHLQFVAVAADTAMQHAAIAAGLRNVQLLQPQADVGAVLAHMDVLLVPSVLQEAFGMVVVDAMLRGIPGGPAGTRLLQKGAQRVIFIDRKQR